MNKPEIQKGSRELHSSLAPGSLWDILKLVFRLQSSILHLLIMVGRRRKRKSDDAEGMVAPGAAAGPAGDAPQPHGKSPVVGPSGAAAGAENDEIETRPREAEAEAEAEAEVETERDEKAELIAIAVTGTTDALLTAVRRAKVS